MAHVIDLFIAEADSEPMQSVTDVQAVANRGLRDDRYFNGTGYYSPYDVCQVTLIAGEAIDEINRESDLDLRAGEHRRNIVTDGIDVHELLKHRFRIGDALLEGTRPRPPCAHVEQVNEQDGVARALKSGRGGICADVVESGQISVGDSITEIEAIDKTGSIIDRLRSKAR
ncbi:MOSC domain-containing protein [Haladaptatus litoreus]|uniref:MOSC domain-containing protein n=1 Tax=Haladaptatus litoreus TaxID=553468 RepID=A0A1N7D124_9EURY|nr:MOSC domain-containing protein [Haladaptatus litoreus]SIR69543.1 MOSC domain-containing protein [Haladaptatus litoreus]